MMRSVIERSPARAAAGAAVLVEADQARTPDILDLYRAVISSIADLFRRGHPGIVAELLLIGAYFVLRTVEANDLALSRWLIVASTAAILSPTTGLVVLAAIAPFNEGLEITRDVGSKTALAIVLLGAVGVRVLIDRGARFRPTVPVLLAAALLVASGLSLLRTEDRWGPEFAQEAAQFWLNAIGTMLIVFFVAVWVARRGIVRPLVVTIVATTIAGLISLADFGSDAAIRSGPLGWAVAGAVVPGRLTGVIRSPTSTAALVMLPVALFIATAILASDWRLRIGAAVAAVPLLTAAYLTYNRGVFIALFALGVVIGWRIRRALGIGILVSGVVIGAVLFPAYLALRGSAVGSGSVALPGQLLIPSDSQRITAWSTAWKMFLDQPILGQGFRSYSRLSVQFGDPILNAPHNEWLRFLAEGGIVAGALAIAFAVATGLVLLRRRGWLETGLFGAFVSLCVAASFNNLFLFSQVTIPAFVLAGTGVAFASRPVPDSTAND
jgi:hypothetical protein